MLWSPGFNRPGEQMAPGIRLDSNINPISNKIYFSYNSPGEPCNNPRENFY